MTEAEIIKSIRIYEGDDRALAVLEAIENIAEQRLSSNYVEDHWVGRELTYIAQALREKLGG